MYDTKDGIGTKLTASYIQGMIRLCPIALEIYDRTTRRS